ncbi:FAD/NAD(P)-binding protein [Rhizobium lemnae]|uniref:FAD/NAD(P)-binding protein n=1 Tax=Rhizobium lemnae TaxID=1214924 RepID=A0ABV8ECK1_9HYPH|nr:FAD/NAD(P)-binding protein [Rhizobium lemnae]MCJ8507026.1 FAD/NAD(P)-binding protein [Rhizobium lemnae]
MSRDRGVPVVAVIGGGFSGAAFALHLVRRHQTGAQILVFEPRAQLGAGLAYSAEDPSHRINVPAARMSLYPDDPESFQRFVDSHGVRHTDPSILTPGGQAYPQRSVFGAYVQAELAPYLEKGAISHRQSRVRSVSRSGDRWLVVDETGSQTPADLVVIATTHPSPQLPSVLRAHATHPRLIADATVSEALANVGADESILIVGNGLTSADVIAMLSRQGHRGNIMAISRRGLRSRGHLAVAQEPFGDFLSHPAKRASELLRRIRQTLRSAETQGLSWHSVIDAVRSQGSGIWQALPMEERRRVARLARPFWDVHRFRIAPQVEQVIEENLKEGRLEVAAAFLKSIDAKDQGFDVVLASKGREQSPRHFDRIIVTTGPAHDGILASQPFLQTLQAAGHLNNCPTGLGIACDATSRAVDSTGKADPSLLIAGPLARGTFGELMGLPQVTEHAVFVADEAAAELRRLQATVPDCSLHPHPSSGPAAIANPTIQLERQRVRS